MTSTALSAVPAGPAAMRLQGLAGVLFRGRANTLLSLVMLAAAAWIIHVLYGWTWRDAVFAGDAARCRAAGGACWAFVIDKLAFSIHGLYPPPERWRPEAVLAVLACAIGASLMRRFWRGELLLAWCVVLAGCFLLLRGGVFGLMPVPMRDWGGFVVTAWLAIIALALSYPLGLALALGRRSRMRVVRWLSIGWIEIVRGVPLVSILILASVIVPLFLPQGLELETLVRAQIAFVMFGSAYLAEVFRGGLQAVGTGQHEAAKALGLTAWQTLRLVVLPQALKVVIPAQVNTFIAIFKDTSLVLVIGIFDFLGAWKATLSDPAWLGFSIEAYVFAALVYFIVCYGMSLYSRRLERELNPELRPSR